MAQVTVLPARDDLPRGGAARETAALACAMALLTLNHAVTQAKLEEGGDPTKVSAALGFFYTITGQVLQAAAAADEFDLTGLTPVPPGFYQKYFFLIDRNEVTRVQEAQPSRSLNGVTLGNLSSNPYEAVINMLNAPAGWAVVGSAAIHVLDTSLVSFTPGTDPLTVGATLDVVEFIDGFDGTVLLPLFNDGSTAQPVGVF